MMAAFLTFALMVWAPIASSFTSDHLFIHKRTKISNGLQQTEPARTSTLWAKRKSKEEIDQMLSGMGVITVKSKGNKSKIAKPTASKNYKEIATRSKPTIDAQLKYARNGHAYLPGLIDSDTVRNIRKEIYGTLKKKELEAYRQKVEVASGSAALASSCNTIADCQLELEALGVTESLPFLQYFNNWRDIPMIKNLAYELGETASILMDVPKVRLYQDSIFWKRRNDGPTPWHVDARQTPFDSSNIITIWIPLTPVAADGTALEFCSKTHVDYALPYWNSLDYEHDEHSEWKRLEKRYPNKPINHMPMILGDATVHSGWTLHCSNGNESDKDRIALAITYVDANAEVRPGVLDRDKKGDDEDQTSYREWVHDVPPRQKFQHELVPIVWPPKSRQ